MAEGCGRKWWEPFSGNHSVLMGVVQCLLVLRCLLLRSLLVADLNSSARCRIEDHFLLFLLHENQVLDVGQTSLNTIPLASGICASTCHQKPKSIPENYKADHYNSDKDVCCVMGPSTASRSRTPCSLNWEVGQSESQNPRFPAGKVNKAPVWPHLNVMIMRCHT